MLEPKGRPPHPIYKWTQMLADKAIYAMDSGLPKFAARSPHDGYEIVLTVTRLPATKAPDAQG